MYSSIDIAAYAVRKPSSAFVVSMWHIPGGYDYAQATPVQGFFDESEKEIADNFVKTNENMPEMANMTTIKVHDEVQAVVLKHRKKKMEDLEYYQRDENSSQVLIVPDRNKEGEAITHAFFFYKGEEEMLWYFEKQLQMPSSYDIGNPVVMSIEDYDAMKQDHPVTG